MDSQNPGPGVTPAPPAAPAEPQTPPAAPEAQPNGSEPDTNPGGQQLEQTVPFNRFQEVNDAKKASDDRVKQLEDELAQSRQQPSTPQNDDDLDPEVEDLIRKGAKKLGLVSQQELDARQMQTQVQQDVRDLESHYTNSGIPYDHRAVMSYAESNNMPITSKAALEAAYRSMNWDKLLEVERQRAIAGVQAGNSSSAERPGSSGAQAPQEPELTGKNPKDRARERIRLARQKLAA